MRPGQFSRDGFLGLHEDLSEVLATDARTVAEMGLSTTDLARPLGELLEAAVRTKKDVVTIGKFRVRIWRFKGTQVCPFSPRPYEEPCPGGNTWMGSFDWEIRNQETGVRLSGPGLIVHLIGVHAFFEGIQSSYRVAPSDLALLLQVGK